jgi:DNA mismatch repair protein MutS
MESAAGVVSRSEMAGPSLGPSVLWEDGAHEPPLETLTPDFFRDLNLDQIVAAITGKKQEYALEPFFHTALEDERAITFRQEVVRDVEQEPIARGLDAFASGMRTMRSRLGLAAGTDYPREAQRWHLGAASAYSAAVEGLAATFDAAMPRSRALLAMQRYLAAYVEGNSFRALSAEVRAVEEQLSQVRYGLHVEGDGVTVTADPGATDYAQEVERFFARFREADARDHHSRFFDSGRLDHIQAQVLDRVARLYPEPFGELAAFGAAHAEFRDPVLDRFDREIQFYLSYRELIAPLRAAGLHFVLPAVSPSSKETELRETFDLALAASLTAARGTVVPNDIVLHGRERLLVVSGPNQGGKSTLARTFGQVHHLARLGLPVPGSVARVFLCDRILVHFERVEEMGTLRGKLEDDLVRMRAILDRATTRSVLVLNEIFSSTTADDAVALGRLVLGEISRLDALAICVTFLDELASFDEKTVSVVSGVRPGDPGTRSFRFERRPPDGLAYALALAERYRVTREWLVRRIGA